METATPMRPSTVGRLLYVPIALLFASGCLGGGARPALPAVTEGCPVILLTRSGGLGFESQTGVVAAVWPSGTILRAASPVGPASGHFMGTLIAADVAALTELVRSARVWDHPRGEVVLDIPDDTLTLRRGTDVRQWAETPGFTSSPIVSEFRSRLFSIAVEDAQRVRGPFDDIMKCATQNREP